MRGLPDYIDGPVGRFELDEHGSILVSCEGERVRIEVFGTALRVYDVWVRHNEEWGQLNRVEEDGVWHSDTPVTMVRLWLGRQVAPAVIKLPVASSETPLTPYVPLADGVPRLPEERIEVPPRLLHWVHEKVEDTTVAAMLQQWDDACARADAMDWNPGVPAGADLLVAFSLTSPAAALDPELAFARWLAFEVGAAVKRGVADRTALELRRRGSKLVLFAMGRVIRAVAAAVEVVANPPPVIGPLERHRWLVDEGLAARVENPVSPDAPHRSVFVLRPLLTAHGDVLVEGEVV